MPTWLRPFLPKTRADRRELAKFVGAVIVLDILFNTRFPAAELHFWYLLPSVDVVFILGAFALLGVQRWRVPKVVHGILVALIVLVRVLRFGDGLQQKYYSQRFSLYSDLPLAPEAVRFAHSTMPWWKFGPLAVAILVTIVLLPVVVYRMLRIAERYLAEPLRVPLIGVLAAAMFGLGCAIPHELMRYGPLFVGGFGSSAMPRIRREATFLVSILAEKGERAEAITRVEQELARTPSNLSKLAHRDVHLILIESYGEVVVERPDFVRTIAPTFESIESELGAKGFSIASGRLVSPTFGGHSWLAHATLGTGIQTTDQFGYDLVCATKPKPIAAFFHEAGYRTVLVHPGTTRPWPKGEFYRFDKRYYFRDFSYKGPAFAWATMPDQFVLDTVRRRELAQRSGPLFIQYVLVSSHAPWSETPTIVEDWSLVGNGSIFDTQPVIRYPIVWPDFTHAQEPYVRSIVYDFELVKRYISKFVENDALVIVLGDHQPVVEVSGDDHHRAVPIHVFSRSRDLVEPFLARGYTPGMWPKSAAEPRRMERFLVDLLRDFSSSEKAASR